MRFERLSSSAFGGLTDLDTGEEALPGLVVVEGRNEAGKSTFFELLATLLYGFYPATRDTHPLSPWDGATAQGRATVCLADGTRYEVSRRLLASPQGSLIRESTEEALRNRTLPFVEHVPRAVFRHVYALTLAELAGLHGEGWDTVQDRLLGAMGASDLRSAREVVEELEAEAGRLWKPNRRGSQRIREVESEIRERKLERHELVTQEGRIRSLTAELDELRRERDAARQEREECRLYVDRFRSLLPIREQLRRVADLVEDAGDPAVLDRLPAEPGTRLDELEARAAELATHLEGLEAASAEPRESVAAYSDADRALVTAETAIDAFVAHASLAPAAQAREAETEQGVRELTRRIDTEVQELLDRGVDSEFEDRLLEISTQNLRDRYGELEGRMRRVEQLETTRFEPEPLPSPGPAWIPLAAALAGLLLLFLPVGGERLPVQIVGGVLLFAGVVLTYQWARIRATAKENAESNRTRKDSLEKARTQAREALTQARASLDELLAPLEPGPDAPAPGPDLPSRLARLQELVRDRRERYGTLEDLGAQRRELDQAAQPLRDLLPTGDRSVDVVALSPLLARALKTATSRRDRASAGARELERLDAETTRTRSELEEVEAEAGRLSDLLREMGGGDLAAGLKEAGHRLQAHQRARQIQAQLQEDHPDLDEIEARIREAETRGEDWAVDPEALAERRLREQALTDRIEELSREIQGLEKDIEHLRARTPLAELDGEVQALEEELAQLVHDRDRLWVLARIVQRAERHLREEHQPAILKEAGELLAELTGGRYDRVLLGGRDGREFRVRGPAAPRPLEIDAPLSTGTREQIYLALRLAVLDQLDRAGEALPLFLDEVLVNWDPERRAAGLSVLARVAERRQCFFFTCHPDLADQLEALGGRRISLAAPPPGSPPPR